MTLDSEGIQPRNVLVTDSIPAGFRRDEAGAHLLGLGLMAQGQSSVVEAMGGMRRPGLSPDCCLWGCR